jgi:xylulokinase
MSTVVGVDSSTQSCKVLAVEMETGAVLASGAAPHPDGTAVDPRVWTAAMGRAWEEAGITAAGSTPAAVSIAGQQHGMVALDEKGLPVHDALLWNDTRSAPQARRMVEDLGEAGWAQAVGSVPVASFTLTKLAWLAEHQPERAERVARVVLPHDYLNSVLTGNYFTDRSDASGTAYFSAEENAYRTDLLERYFGRVPALPEVLEPSESGGRLLPEWGLRGTLVAAGAGDNAGAALGLGIRPGEIVVSVGTSGTVFTSAQRPLHDDTGTVAGFADATGDYLPLLAMINSARVMSATAAMLGVALPELDRLAQAAAPDAGGLTLLPYLDGERTPNLPDARGTLFGMSRTNMVPENLARAAVLGVLNSLADARGLLEGHAVPVERVLLIGGGSKSTALRQAAADVLGVPVEIPSPAEYVALGAARQAAWAATGEYPDWTRTIEACHEPSNAGWAAEVRSRYGAAREALYGAG